MFGNHLLFTSVLGSNYVDKWNSYNCWEANIGNKSYQVKSSYCHPLDRIERPKQKDAHASYER